MGDKMGKVNPQHKYINGTIMLAHIILIKDYLPGELSQGEQDKNIAFFLQLMGTKETSETFKRKGCSEKKHPKSIQYLFTNQCQKK